MLSPHRRTLAMLVLGLLVSWSAATTRASAQSLPATFRIAPELALAIKQEPPVPLVPRDEYAVPKVRSGRAMRAAGLGMLLGGAVSAALGVRGHICPDDDAYFTNRGYLYTGIVTASVGLALTIGGTIRLKSVADAPPRKARATAWRTFLAVGTASTSLVAGVLASLKERIVCGNI